MNISGPSSALAAIQRQSQAMERAASRIARAGLNDPVNVPANPDSVEPLTFDGDLASATVDSLAARSLLTAAVRLARTANENIATVLRIGGYLTERT